MAAGAVRLSALAPLGRSSVARRARLNRAVWIGGQDVLEQRVHIHIDAADTTAAQVWLDPAKAQEWVLGQLKAQGIVMRAA